MNPRANAIERDRLAQRHQDVDAAKRREEDAMARAAQAWKRAEMAYRDAEEATGRAALAHTRAARTHERAARLHEAAADVQGRHPQEARDHDGQQREQLAAG